MARQLPENRRGLRLTAMALIPVYLVLWVAGTGCYGEIAFYDIELARCLFVMDLLLGLGVSEAELLSVVWGVSLSVPPGMFEVSGSSKSSGANTGTVSLMHYDQADNLEDRIDWVLFLSSSGELSDQMAIDSLDIKPGDKTALLIAFEDALADLLAGFFYEADVQDPVPTFRFPDSARRAKFIKVFDAEFGVPYELPAGVLVIQGSVAPSAGSRVNVPKKVIVEVAHLNDAGKVVTKHKQIIKIRNNGSFKPSAKAFNGFDLEEGERVRLRLKPKKGDLTGLDWMLVPVYNRDQ